jgi:hypothetical protein
MTCPTKIEILAAQILQKLPKLSAWRRRFLIRLFGLWPALLGRHNFVNLSRQGEYNEYTYRKHFARYFDFMAFNSELVARFAGPRRIIALDPSYLRKSGRHTAGVGYFHSGSAGKREWGLEITGLAAVDLDDKTAYHLEAIQTVGRDSEESLLDYYASVPELRSQALLRISKYLVADAYFSRNPFIGRVREAGFHLISRLRKDAHLRYFYAGPQSGKGRPKQYAGKVDLLSLDPTVFQPVSTLSSDRTQVYQGVVELKAAKMAIKAVVVRQLDTEARTKSVKVYMSTHTTQAAEEIIHAYRCRYQQEFLFRDAKQFSGLEEGQARDWPKIDFHVNASLTVVNLAKAAHHLNVPAAERGAFSMADITTAYANERLALRIFRRCGIDPNLPKIQAILQEVRNYAARAA